MFKYLPFLWAGETDLLVIPPALLQLFSFRSEWTEQGALGRNLNSKCAENGCFQRKQNTQK